MFQVLVIDYIYRFKEDFEQFWFNGKIERAYELYRIVSKDPKKIIRYGLPPYPFFGNLYSETVMVNLNPGIKSNEEITPGMLSTIHINNFNDYYNYLFNFGEIRYQDGSSVDGFDTKQVAFLIYYDQETKNLGFEDKGDTNRTSSHLPNLRMLLSNRCQLELIPYGSTRFDTRDFRNETTMEYFHELMGVICSVERKIVFFNGSIFRFLLNKSSDIYKVEMTPRYGNHLFKKDGSVTKNKYYYSYGFFTHGTKKVPFIISDSFSQQGLNGDLMRQYGELVTKDALTRIVIL